jgi:hypothetical protein
MARMLTMRQRTELAELMPKYAHRVWVLSASRNQVTLWIFGDDNGVVSQWTFFEKERHFTMRKNVVSAPTVDQPLLKASRELWKYAALRALEIIFAVRAGHMEATEHRRAKKEKKEAQKRAVEPMLPFGYHETHARKRS